MNFGLKGGFNLANLHGEDVDTEGPRLGLKFGGFMEYKVSENFSIQPELYYSQQGTKVEENNIDGTYKLDYLNLPVLGKIYVNKQFSINVGLQLGILLLGELEIESGDDSATKDIKDNLNKADFGFCFGGEFYVSDKISFNARLNSEIVGIFKDVDSEDEKYNPKNIHFNVGMNFRF